MKLFEIISQTHILAPHSDFIGKPVGKLPCIYDPKYRDIGRTSTISPQTVVVKNTKTKQIVGNRTIWQKNVNSPKAPLPWDDLKYSSIK